MHGSRCLITGGSRGIGRAIAFRFAQLGASCKIVGRDQTTLMEVQAELDSISKSHAVDQGLTGGDDKKLEKPTHSFLVGDVSRRNFWKSLSEQATAGDKVDILVNAAGIAQSSLLMRTSPETVQALIDTNLMSTLWSCRFIPRLMLSQRRSREQQSSEKTTACIINISSLLGSRGGVGSSVYAASKAAVTSLTRSLAAELGPLGIRVNSISPGYIETNMTAVLHAELRAFQLLRKLMYKGMHPETRQRALASIPLRRFGRDYEVAQAAEFLALNEYANNCSINLDGGLSASFL